MNSDAWWFSFFLPFASILLAVELFSNTILFSKIDRSCQLYSLTKHELKKSIKDPRMETTKTVSLFFGRERGSNRQIFRLRIDEEQKTILEKSKVFESLTANVTFLKLTLWNFCSGIERPQQIVPWYDWLVFSRRLLFEAWIYIVRWRKFWIRTVFHHWLQIEVHMFHSIYFQNL